MRFAFRGPIIGLRDFANAGDRKHLSKQLTQGRPRKLANNVTPAQFHNFSWDHYAKADT